LIIVVNLYLYVNGKHKKYTVNTLNNSSGNVADKRLKIAIVTAVGFGDYQQGIAKFSVSNKEEYAQRHGYSLRVLNQSLDTRRSFAWSKILFIRNIIEEDILMDFLDR